MIDSVSYVPCQLANNTGAWGSGSGNIDNEDRQRNNQFILQSIAEALTGHLIALCLSLYTVTILWYLFVLSGYHVYLLVIGQTTNENLRHVYEGQRNPFDRGCCGNMLFVCCTPAPPSLLPDQSAVLSAKEFVCELYPGLFNEESNWQSSNITTDLTTAAPLSADSSASRNAGYRTAVGNQPTPSDITQAAAAGGAVRGYSPSIDFPGTPPRIVSHRDRRLPTPLTSLLPPAATGAGTGTGSGSDGGSGSGSGSGSDGGSGSGSGSGSDGGSGSGGELTGFWLFGMGQQVSQQVSQITGRITSQITSPVRTSYGSVSTTTGTEVTAAAVAAAAAAASAAVMPAAAAAAAVMPAAGDGRLGTRLPV